MIDLNKVFWDAFEDKFESKLQNKKTRQKPTLSGELIPESQKSETEIWLTHYHEALKAELAKQGIKI